ncbi:hypothetical protein [Streptomyces erythrochromogenes]|uniref:hypothetical protein n=1 Tax=Streptomyces erythrochromogenes TaxID=285574 RepID=UPI0002ED108B|nr:hypothetical protein OG489_35855 [Streptomyces erythrochromogenes]
MSVNIDLAFTVTGVAGEPQAREIVGALEELMRDESIDGYVRITLDVGEDGACLVSGKSRFPLSISGFHRWQPHFEGLFAFTVAEVAAAARTEIDWGYPDEEY